MSLHLKSLRSGRNNVAPRAAIAERGDHRPKRPRACETGGISHEINACCTARKTRRSEKTQQRPFEAELIIAAVEAVLGMSRNDLYGSGKNAQAVMAKEVLILTGRQTGASFPQLANLTGLDPSTVSRRYEAAKRKAGARTPNWLMQKSL